VEFEARVAGKGTAVTVQTPRVLLAAWQTIEAFHQALTNAASLVVAPTARDDDVIPLLPGADVLVSGRFSRAMTAHAHALKLIQSPGAGVNGIDFAAVPAGTTVCNVYGHERGIAEYVFMTMAALNRDLFGLDRRLRAGNWQDHLGAPQRELRGRTVAIVGLGQIGTEVARWARFLDMRVVAATRTPDRHRTLDLGITRLDGLNALRELLAEADFVVVAVPLDERTRGLFGRDEMRSMKPSAYLINVARGEVVDETALYEALRDRVIAGAAIDVWYRYPDRDEPTAPSRYPFDELSNLFMTPHIAGATDATYRYRWSVINDNLRRLGSGDPLLNVVYPNP
jgi:phosphoglycerate dehydrogenase-like enzyme